MGYSTITSLNAVSTPGQGSSLTFANGTTWPTTYMLNIQTTGRYPVFALQLEGSVTGITWKPVFGPFTATGDYVYNQVIGHQRHGDVLNTVSWPQLHANLLWVWPSLMDAAAQFSGSISGNTLTVSGTVTGTIAVGQTLTAVGSNFNSGAAVTTPIPNGVTITGGSGTSWTLSQSLGTVSAQALYTAPAPTVTATITAE